MKASVSSTTSGLITRAMRRSSMSAGAAILRVTPRPGLRVGTGARPGTEPRRSGASRKSRALRLGGVDDHEVESRLCVELVEPLHGHELAGTRQLVERLR